MKNDDQLTRLRNMVLQVVDEPTLESSSAGLESMRLPEQQHEAAASALEGLAQNRAINADERNTLEAIVLPKLRPVINIIGGTFDKPPNPWEHLGSTEQKRRIENVVQSIGRVEVPGHPTAPYAGTGFVVGKKVLMTNRHVAEIFATGLGRQDLLFKSGINAAVDFKREILPSDPELLLVDRVLMIHPYWDMALLEVSGLTDAHHELSLSTNHPDDLIDREVVIIGYPAQDWRNDLDLQNRIFGGVFRVKRLQPGKLRKRRMIESFGHEVNAMTHDASTLGGNSGSAVINVQTGEVVALHFAGLYLDANFGVPTWELARDKFVVDSGVNFNGSVEQTSDWAAVWRLAHQSQETTIMPTKTGDQISAGQTATFTIPLTVSVTVGTPETSAMAPPTKPQPRTSEMDLEGLFSRRDPDVIKKAYQGFSRVALSTASFSWAAALSAADCSHLVYDDSAVVIETVREVWEFDTCEFLANDETECFVASTDDVIVVSFRGTAGIGDWITDLNAFSTTAAYGTVHRGFYFAFQAVKSSLENLINNIATDRPIVMTGHSLGGALATIAAAEWNGVYPISGIYTYGQPAVGKQNFKQFFQPIYGSKLFRVVNDDDIVAQVPPGYRHVGRLFHFGPSGGIQKSLAEASPDATRPDTMSDNQFAQLQETLRAANEPGSVESMEEGLLPSFSDHKLERYMKKILGKVVG